MLTVQSPTIPELPASVPASQRAAYKRRVAFLTGKSLPRIIDAPGKYLTRAGRLVVIFEITSTEKATFNCKGSVFFPPLKPNGKEISIFNTWQANGRKVALGEDPSDIVKKFE